MGMIQEIADVVMGTNVAGRQERQWQQANDNLDEAEAALRPLMADSGWYPSESDPRTAAQVAIAHALIGLLADRLSRR